MYDTVIKFIIYFIVGVIQDFFFTLNSRYIAEKKVWPATAFSFLTILMSMVVLYNILNELDSEKSIAAIFFYSVGISLGTYLAMKFEGFKKG
ncbi:MAG: hypothetical protein HYT36_01655 [Candidatus Staskawiczbacteria bacterium]|nr:hypothetical protein [Candidatus Staskawiczbacteria bacterium]